MEPQNRIDDIPAEAMILRLLVKVSIYYVALFLVLFAAWSVFGDLTAYLPLGGVGDVGGGAAPSIYELEEALLNGDQDDIDRLAEETGGSSAWFAEARALSLAMLGSLLLMLPVSWLYKGIHSDGDHDHSLDETALILPAVVAGIVLIVQHSLALAFSLAGIVAGVQFRRALNDTFDTLFIFVAIGVGIAAGTGALEIAAVMSIFFNYSTLLVALFGDGLQSHHDSRKKALRRERKRAKALREAETAE